MKPFVWLCPLLPLLPTVRTAVVGPSLGPTGRDIDPCAIKAWVRAPDLDPGKIIPGQVRIQARGSCDPILEYSLILRFKERVRANLLNPDAELPEKPSRYLPCNISRVGQHTMSGNPPGVLEANPLWQEYLNAMRNPTLWTVVEEEHVAFESSYKLFEGSTPGGQLIRNFALLVPTTNYPPSLVAIGRSVNLDGEPTSEREHQHSYLYSVEAKFLNGTTIEVPAGYSAFNTLNPNPQAQNNNNVSEVVTFRAHFTRWDIHSSNNFSNALNLSFNVNVTLPHGRNLEQGQWSFEDNHFSTADIDLGTNHRLTFMLWDDSGPIADIYKNHTIALTPPTIGLRMSSQERQMQRLFPGKNISIPSTVFMRRCQLSHAKTKRSWCGPLWEKRKRGENWNTTTSESFDVAPVIFPSFDMYYQSFQAHLQITLNIASDSWNEDDTFDEDYEWTPVMTRRVRQRFMPFSTEIPITVSPNAKQDFHTTHYLSPDARQPVFIDPSTASSLLELSVEERDLLAPKSTPVIKVTDDIVRERYYQPSLYYVGDVWQRKVLNGGIKKANLEEGGIKADPLLVQLAN